MKIDDNAVSIKTLERFYHKRMLTDYLTTLSDMELLIARCDIEVDDIVGDRIGILDAVMQEMEYRNDNKIYEERESTGKSR